MATWEKQNSKIFIDTSTTPNTPDWARIVYSTVFDLAFNAETETLDYISSAAPTDMIKTYKPSMDQETVLEEGDDLFDYMFDLMQSLPTGTAAERPCLIVFPKAGTTTGTFVAWKVNATITFKNYNPVDKKLTFSLTFAGDIAKGTVTITSGTPTFTETGSEP